MEKRIPFTRRKLEARQRQNDEVGRLDQNDLALSAAQIELCSAQQFPQFFDDVLAWQDPTDASESLQFFDVVLQKMVKIRYEQAIQLKDALWLCYQILKLSEMKNENGDKALKSCAKFISRICAPVRDELIATIWTEIPFGFGAKYELMAYFRAESLGVIFAQHNLLLEFLYCAEHQVFCSAASALIAICAREIPAKIKALFISCLLHQYGVVRVNVLRCWISRLSNIKELEPFVDSLFDSLEQIFYSKPKSAWPPRTADEYEDLSCLIPDDLWRESELSVTTRDKALYAILFLANAVNPRQKTRSAQLLNKLVVGQIFKLALLWPNSDIRLLAHDMLEMLRSCDMSAYNDLFAFFARLVRKNQTPGPAEKGSKDELLTLLNKTEVFSPDIVSVCDLIRDIEKLLSCSGSDGIGTCPTFTELAQNCAAHNMKVIEFSQSLLKKLEIMVQLRGNADDDIMRKIFTCIWSVLLRTRHKAVIENGSQHFYTIQRLVPNDMLEEFFQKTVDIATSNIPVRNVALSKILWSFCDTDENKLLYCWNVFQKGLSAKENALTARFLKMTKYFISREAFSSRLRNCDLLFLFKASFCFAKNSDDFLVRSAAIMLFGFVIRLILKEQKYVFYYDLLSNFPEMHAHLKTILHNIQTFPEHCRILLLSFLNFYRLGCRYFYSEDQLSCIRAMTSQLWNLASGCIEMREKRAIVHCLANFTAFNSRYSVSLDLLELNDDLLCEYYKDRLSWLWIPRLPKVYDMKVPAVFAKQPKILAVADFSKLLESKNHEEILAVLKAHEQRSLDDEMYSNITAYCLVLLAEKGYLSRSCSFSEAYKRVLVNTLQLDGHSAIIAARAVTQSNLKDVEAAKLLEMSFSVVEKK